VVYEVQQRRVKQRNWQFSHVKENLTSDAAYVEGLEEGHKYAFRLRAKLGSKASQWSDQSKFLRVEWPIGWLVICIHYCMHIHYLL
jgi:hypothetical protein